MRKSGALFLMFLVFASVFASGCMSNGTSSGTHTTSSSGSASAHSTTSPSAPASHPAKIDFDEYVLGGVIGNWSGLFGETFYVSSGYGDLVKHYFPSARVLPFSKYNGTGIAVLSPGDSEKVLFGKPIHIDDVDYFGYVAYRYGFHFVGPWEGVIAAFNSKSGGTLVVSGTSRAGIGAALNFLKELKDGKTQVNSVDVLRVGDFEGIVVKEIGDVNYNGIPDSDEHVAIYQLLMSEPFQYWWRVVKGENVTVQGGFIRLVNGTRVYIRALGFNVTVDVKGAKGVPLTYVIENVNPSLMELPAGAKVVGNTTVEVKTSKARFSIVAKKLDTYRVLAFGDHRPPKGDNPPEAFLTIMNDINHERGAFIIDGGDLVYSGGIYQWANLMKVWNWNRPIFIAAGNHEYRGEGIDIFHYLFGPTDYSFSLGGYRYIFANDVMHDYRITDAQFKWIREQMELAKERGERPVVVMHAPPYDPRPGGDDHAMSESSAKELLSLMREYKAFGIFSHIHLYWNGTYPLHHNRWRRGPALRSPGRGRLPPLRDSHHGTGRQDFN